MTDGTTEITVVGDDADIVVEMTAFLFERDVDITGLDQAAQEGTVRTTVHVDTSEMATSRETFREDLDDLGDDLGVNVRVRFPADRETQSIAVLVTKESHCLEALLEAWVDGDLGADIEVVIGNHDDLQPLAAKYDVPFHDIGDESGTPDEGRLLDLLDDHDIDLIALARYIRILSPEVVFRYESRIINVHPSLLPAFPGASAYSQAVEEGVRIAGVTAHYVTTDLDQGPIITQRAFNVPDGATKTDLQKRGQPLEAEALTEAIKLHIDDEITVRRGQTTLHNPEETDAQLGAPEELDRQTPDRPIDVDEFVVGDLDETVSADD
ncbi:formyltetrahydrofolate deformylase [Halomicrococcus sp. SG-WS-1]|uniref:formyltetrahydrofolate deformylase n=1 Tax=Halomicrococcus sp. SG-WS-1 TaxID=3439057 RepID=UPI003F7A4620